jgi:hypothetical protein
MRSQRGRPPWAAATAAGSSQAERALRPLREPHLVVPRVAAAALATPTHLSPPTSPSMTSTLPRQMSTDTPCCLMPHCSGKAKGSAHVTRHCAQAILWGGPSRCNGSQLSQDLALWFRNVKQRWAANDLGSSSLRSPARDLQFPLDPILQPLHDQVALQLSGRKNNAADTLFHWGRIVLVKIWKVSWHNLHPMLH